MASATNRRAVLAATLAAGASAAMPAASAAQSPVLSAIDRRVISLWRRRRKLYEIQGGCERKKAAVATQKGPRERIVHWRQRSNDCDYFLNTVEDELDELISASTLALGAGLIVAHHGDDNRHLRPLFRAALTLIRPSLTDLIAEDADRVLAQAEEAA